MKESKRKGGSAARVVLPRSGLAEDVLGSLPGANNAGPDLAGPDRVYVFADLLREKTATRAEQKPEDEVGTWVVFSLGAESFALPATHVKEILRVSDITRVPHAPSPVKGITNVRGHVLPVVDLRVRIGLPGAPQDEKSRILVLETKGRLIGLLVDAARQVVRIARSAVQKAPPDVMTAQSYYILGLHHGEGGLVILLDVERVLVLDAPPGGGG